VDGVHKEVLCPFFFFHFFFLFSFFKATTIEIKDGHPLMNTGGEGNYVTTRS